MGSYCSRVSTSDDFKNTSHSNTRKKYESLVNDTSYPLNAEALKTLTLGILSLFTEKKQLSAYRSMLRRFIESYNYAKFAPFLSKLSWFAMEGHRGSEVKGGNETADMTYMHLSMTTGRENSVHLENTHMLKGSESGFKDMTTSKNATQIERLLEFLKHELLQKDNFFCEMMAQIGNCYMRQNGEHLHKFEEILSVINETEKGLYVEYNLEEETKSEINIVFEMAKEEIQQIEDFIYNCLKVLLTQLSKRSKGDSSLVPGESELNELTWKLLFEKNKCSWTFFQLTRYYTIEDEINLRNAYTRLKGVRPERFGIDPEFCQEGEEVPYAAVVDLISDFEKHSTPNKKFHLMYSIRKHILEEVDRYRKERLPNSKPLFVSGDHLLPLYTFCLAQNGNEQLRAHQIFVETFLPREKLEFDEEGYCYSTFVGAVDSLVSRKDVRESIRDAVKKLSHYSSITSQKTL